MVQSQSRVRYVGWIPYNFIYLFNGFKIFNGAKLEKKKIIKVFNGGKFPPFLYYQRPALVGVKGQDPFQHRAICTESERL